MGKKGGSRKKGEKSEGGTTQIYTDGDVVTGKGGPSELWVYGGCCLGNRPIGLAVAYVMSQVSEVPVLTDAPSS